MSYFGVFLNVKNNKGGICNGFGEKDLCVGAESRSDLLRRRIRIHKSTFDPQFLKCYGKKIKGSAVNGGSGNHMVSGFADVENRIEIGSLSGRSKKGGDASLQRGNLGSYSIVGGVLQTGIKISLCLQVKKLSHFVGGIIFKCGTLINGKGAGLSFGRRIACVKTFGFQFRVVDVHIQVLLSCINHLYPPFSAGCPSHYRAIR